MVNDKRPGIVRKQRASFSNVCRAHQAFKRFTARDFAIMRNGRKMVKGLIAQREMATPFVAVVNASGHKGPQRSCPQ